MNKKDKNFIINSVLFIILINAIVIAHSSFKSSDLIAIAKWYGLTVGLTLVGLPICFKLFKNFIDKGYIFAKVLGFFIPGYLMWLLASLHILKFNTVTAYLCLLIVALIVYVPLIIKLIKSDNRKELVLGLKNKLQIFYRIEICFIVLLLLVCYLKAFYPDANSSEKYMDYGYMAVIDHSDYMPPKDSWLSGKTINYYYFGHYICTYTIKLSTVGVNYGYNFSLITLFLILFFANYSICFNLLSMNNSNKKKSLPLIGGLLGALAISVAGNFHYVVYKMIIPAYNTIFHLESDYIYSFYDSTRYIGHNPDTIDKALTEFPSFSAIVGDMHSHYVNLFFVSLLLAVLLTYLLNNRKLIENSSSETRKLATSKNVFNPVNILLGLLLGIMKMANYWDFPIYFVVVMMIFFISDLIIYKDLKNVLNMNIFRIIVLIIISSIASLPFTLNFIKMASKIAISPYRTKFYQLVILWGLPTFMVVCYLLVLVTRNLPKKVNKNTFIEIVRKQKVSDLYIIIVGICAIGLIIVPEIFYVVDIYFDGPVRFNTIFKFTYQSFVLFSICYGYILVKLCSDDDRWIKGIGKTLTILFLLTCCYGYTGAKEWFGDITHKDYYKSLDAREFLERSHLDYLDVTTLDNAQVVKYINKNVSKDAVVLEAGGESFSSDNQISTFTGRATLLGWNAHEWLWRSENSNFDHPNILIEREAAIDVLYHENDLEKVTKLIKKYNINYIVIGQTERHKYGGDDLILENEDLLLSLGKVVLETNKNKSLPTYLIKINKDLLK